MNTRRRREGEGVVNVIAELMSLPRIKGLGKRHAQTDNRHCLSILFDSERHRPMALQEVLRGACYSRFLPSSSFCVTHAYV